MIFIKYLVFAALVFSGAVWAGDVEDAMKANSKGDFIAELKITRPLASKGAVWAQHFLGKSYFFGTGVAQDYVEAAKWYKLAAAQGLASAQSNLGQMYSDGQGVFQDYAEGVRWYRLAAAQGEANAQRNLALSYYMGQGVIQNYVLSHLWMNLASLNSPNNRLRLDRIATKMTQQQIEEAQKLAQECQARNFKNCD